MLLWPSSFHLRFASLIARPDIFLWAFGALQWTLSPPEVACYAVLVVRVHVLILYPRSMVLVD